MFHGLTDALNGAVMERATLWLNHVLASETIATQKLRPHAGRSVRVQLQGWPTILPPPPAIAFRITPAGLLEWCGGEPVDAELTMSVDASNPALAMAQALTGERPKVDIAGDAALAADLGWLVENLRWDYEDDLARVVGPVPAREITRVASGAAAGLRALARSVGARATGAPAGTDSGPKGTGSAGPGRP